jgi:hypothetical protein
MVVADVSISMTGNYTVFDGVNYRGAKPGDSPARETDSVKRTSDEIAITSVSQIETASRVNRFLLCAVVSESAKRIKVRAEKMGESLPITMIVRSFLRSYRAEDGCRPPQGSDPDTTNLRDLRDKVLRNEIERTSTDRIQTSKGRLAQAARRGDDAAIEAERDILEQTVKRLDQLTTGARQLSDK